MKNMINELWHGNIIPKEDSRNNSKEMKELLGYEEQVFMLQDVATFYQNVRLSCCKIKESMI